MNGCNAITMIATDQEGKPGTQSLFRSDELRLEIAKYLCKINLTIKKSLRCKIFQY